MSQNQNTFHDESRLEKTSQALKNNDAEIIKNSETKLEKEKKSGGGSLRTFLIILASAVVGILVYSYVFDESFETVEFGSMVLMPLFGMFFLLYGYTGIRAIKDREARIIFTVSTLSGVALAFITSDDSTLRESIFFAWPVGAFAGLVVAGFLVILFFGEEEAGHLEQSPLLSSESLEHQEDDWDLLEEEGSQQDQEPDSPSHLSAESSEIQIFNEGMSHFAEGDYQEASRSFKRCIEFGDYKSQATYALVMCYHEMEQEIPESLKSEAAKTRPVFLASFIASALIHSGHKAALTEQGERSKVEAVMDSTKYVISVDGIADQFKVNAWRIEKDTEIDLFDIHLIPEATSHDYFVRGLAEVGSPQRCFALPRNGLPTSISMESSRYVEPIWNLSFEYPSDWKITFEKVHLGAWFVPIGVGGEEESGGRPNFMVNIREDPVLSEHVQPRNRKEYIEEIISASEDGKLPNWKLKNATELEVDGKPSALISHTWDGEYGSIREDYLTVFCEDITYLFICEAPELNWDKYQGVFESIINSLEIDGEGLELLCRDTVDSSPLVSAKSREIQLFNEGMRHFEQGDYEEASEKFELCTKSGDYKLQAAYAMAMCLHEMDLDVIIPENLEDKTDEVGPVYLASYIASVIIAAGHEAALTEQGERSKVEAVLDSTKYEIYVTDVLGQFLVNAWRAEKDMEIDIFDTHLNPDPTQQDIFIRRLAQHRASARTFTLPPDGLPTSLNITGKSD